VSFLTIGVIWLNHHRIFEQVARVDGPLLLLNLNLLLWTALIPFPTAVVAEHLVLRQATFALLMILPRRRSRVLRFRQAM
jgi:uncharacterized membrane protein